MRSLLLLFLCFLTLVAKDNFIYDTTSEDLLIRKLYAFDTRLKQLESKVDKMTISQADKSTKQNNRLYRLKKEVTSLRTELRTLDRSFKAPKKVEMNTTAMVSMAHFEQFKHEITTQLKPEKIDAKDKGQWMMRIESLEARNAKMAKMLSQSMQEHPSSMLEAYLDYLIITLSILLLIAFSIAASAHSKASATAKRLDAYQSRRRKSEDKK